MCCDNAFHVSNGDPIERGLLEPDYWLHHWILCPIILLHDGSVGNRRQHQLTGALNGCSNAAPSEHAVRVSAPTRHILGPYAGDVVVMRQVVVPDWPMFRKDPIAFLDDLPAEDKELESEGHAADTAKGANPGEDVAPAPVSASSPAGDSGSRARRRRKGRRGE